MTWALFWEWTIKSLILIFTLLIGFGYLTWYERRFLARIQVRIGPNRAGPQGLMQWMADAVKLIFKEELTPDKVYKLVFFFAPVVGATFKIIDNASTKAVDGTFNGLPEGKVFGASGAPFQQQKMTGFPSSSETFGT